MRDRKHNLVPVSTIKTLQFNVYAGVLAPFRFSIVPTRGSCILLTFIIYLVRVDIHHLSCIMT